MSTTTLVYTTVASSASSGPLVQSLSAAQMAALAYDYVANYSQFLTSAQSLINQDVQTIEKDEPEGQRNYLTINGWGSSATDAANAINNQWQAGKVVGPDGVPVAAWPEYPSQIAWATDGNTLEMRWLKEEWQLYLLVFVLIAVVGYLVYRVLTGGTYSLQTADEKTASSTSTNPVVSTSGGLSLFGIKWYWYVGGAAVLAGTPWTYRQIVKIKEDRAADLVADADLREAR